MVDGVDCGVRLLKIRKLDLALAGCKALDKIFNLFLSQAIHCENRW